MNLLLEKWINSSLLTTKEKQEIKKLSVEEKEVYFKDQLLSFGTAGVRGIMGMGTMKMNRFTYTQLSYTYGKYLVNKFGKNKTVIIGHDNRLNSDTFAILCANVLTSFGLKPLLFKNNKLMPTPIISYAIRQTKSIGGIIVTASHNPKEYNGFKVYNPDGGQVLPDVVEQITKYMCKPIDILDIVYKPNKKLIGYVNDSLINKYMNDVQAALVDKSVTRKTKSFPIVFTGHHGTSCKLIPIFLKKLKFNVKPVIKQCFYNPNFINSPVSNPEDFKSFDLAIKQANKIKSKIIIGIDPDADRMAVCLKHHDKWRLMTGNEMGIIYTYYVLKHRKFTKTPYIISSYVSTYLIDRIAKEYKAKVYRTGTGFKWMGAKVSEINNKQQFVVAFEEAIGALNTTINRDKDSFSASSLALEIYHKYQNKNMDFVDILEKEIYPQFGHWFGKTDSYVFKEINWKPLVLKKMNFFKTYKINRIASLNIKNIKWNKIGDCLEWQLQDDSWIKFRMSGTEPKFKIYYNLYGNNQDDLNNQYQELKNTFDKLVLT